MAMHMANADAFQIRYVTVYDFNTDAGTKQVVQKYHKSNNQSVKQIVYLAKGKKERKK